MSAMKVTFTPLNRLETMSIPTWKNLRNRLDNFGILDSMYQTLMIREMGKASLSR